MAVEIQVRRDTAADWTSANSVLAQGEWGLETDTTYMKIGNGASTWTQLPYQVGANTYVTFTDPTVTYLSDPTFGAALNGTTDDTTAMAAAVAATIEGGTLLLPSKPIKLASNWVPGKAINISGSGWWNVNNAAFGDASWASTNYGTNFGGTVIILTGATSGNGLTLGASVGSEEYRACSVRDVMLLGPGTGVGVGLLLQHIVGYKATNNVLCANFAKAHALVGVEDCHVNGLRSRGCSTGATLDSTTNNNTLISYESQFASIIGFHDSGTANKWGTPLVQNCTGQPFMLDGSGSKVELLYMENASATAAASVGNSATIERPILVTAADLIKFSGGYSLYVGQSWSGQVTNTGTGNNLQFTDTTWQLATPLPVVLTSGYVELPSDTSITSPVDLLTTSTLAAGTYLFNATLTATGASVSGNCDFYFAGTYVTPAAQGTSQFFATTDLYQSVTITAILTLSAPCTVFVQAYPDGTLAGAKVKKNGAVTGAVVTSIGWVAT